MTVMPTTPEDHEKAAQRLTNEANELDGQAMVAPYETKQRELSLANEHREILPHQTATMW